MKIITFFIMIAIIPFSFARKPAIEPVQGISIDHYKEVPPSQDKGFNFNSGPSETVKTHDVQTNPSHSSSSENSPWPAAFAFTFFMLLPALLWWAVLSKTENEFEESNSDNEFVGNTYDLSEERIKRQSAHDDDDSHYPKAG